MTGKEINGYCVAREAIEEELTVKATARILSLSERQVYRLKKKVRDSGHVDENPWKSRQATLYKEISYS